MTLDAPIVVRLMGTSKSKNGNNVPKEYLRLHP